MRQVNVVLAVAFVAQLRLFTRVVDCQPIDVSSSLGECQVKSKPKQHPYFPKSNNNGTINGLPRPIGLGLCSGLAQWKT